MRSGQGVRRDSEDRDFVPESEDEESEEEEEVEELRPTTAKKANKRPGKAKDTFVTVPPGADQNTKAVLQSIGEKYFIKLYRSPHKNCGLAD